MFRRFVLGLGALLGAFHLWLLGNQAWSGQLAEPDVVLRWLGALALVGGLMTLRRLGESLVGRKAVVVWVLAALLHGPSLANDLDGFATPPLSEAVATVGQAVVAASLLALSMLALFAIRRSRNRFLLRTVAAATAFPVRLLDAESGLGFLPRPPPLS